MYTLKNTTSIPITLPWKCPPGGGGGSKINYSYAESLLFVWLNGCSTQVEVKSRKTKENGISNIQENDIHLSDEGNTYIKTNLHIRCLRKIIKKRGTQIVSWTNIYMAFSVVWTENQQFLGHPVFITNATNILAKRLTLNFHEIPAFVKFPAPGQLSEIKSRPSRALLLS